MLARYDNRYKAIRYGAFIGFLLSLVLALYFQIVPRLNPHPELVFHGAPQGQDQLIYMAMVRAIWRSPNLITYSYPFALWWPVPPVLFQFPLTLIAWLGKVTGLPLAFEAMRIAGATVTGAFLAALGVRLVRSSHLRVIFWIATAFAGGWFWIRGVSLALETAGLAGLTEFAEYAKRSQGPLFYWMPFLAENVVYPLECAYHALFFGTIFSLLRRRRKLALLLGTLTWFSNPFSAIALTAPVGLWQLSRVVFCRKHRSGRFVEAAAWLFICLVGASYYALFLPQLPALRAVSKLYHTDLLPPLSLLQMALLLGPWLVGFLWSVGTRAGRSAVWRNPAWRLVALIAVTQFALVQQGLVLGEKALQPHHYNRGYMHWAFAALFVRFVAFNAAVVRKKQWLMPLFIASVLPDHAVFFYKALVQYDGGFVSRDLAEVVEAANKRDRGKVIYNEPAGSGAYIAAASNNVPFDIPEAMVVPFAQERHQKLYDAISRQDNVEQMGITFAIVEPDGDKQRALLQRGWVVVKKNDEFVLLRAP